MNAGTAIAIVLSSLLCRRLARRQGRAFELVSLLAAVNVASRSP